LYFTCPHCQTAQTVKSLKTGNSFAHINVQDHALGEVGLRFVAVGCANSKCKQLTVDVALISAAKHPNGYMAASPRPTLHYKQP